MAEKSRAFGPQNVQPGSSPPSPASRTCGIRAISSRALLSLFLPVLSLPPLLIACPGPHGQNHLESDRKRQESSTCAIQNVGNWENVIWILILQERTEENNLERGLSLEGGGICPILNRKKEKRWSLVSGLFGKSRNTPELVATGSWSRIQLLHICFTPFHYRDRMLEEILELSAHHSTWSGIAIDLHI